MSDSKYAKDRAKFDYLVDQGLADAVVKVYTDPAIAHLSLTFQGRHFNAALLRQAADLIKKKRIKSCFDRKKDILRYEYNALYLEHSDVLLTNFRPMDTNALSKELYGKSGLIHEGAHMIDDIHGKPLPAINTELSAYIFQAMYLRMVGMTGNNVPGATEPTLFPAAFVLADRYLAHQAPLLLDVEKLEAAIRRQSIYKGIDMKTRHFNGIGGR
jgi:hypothetical protein